MCNGRADVEVYRQQILELNMGNNYLKRDLVNFMDIDKINLGLGMPQ